MSKRKTKRQSVPLPVVEVALPKALPAPLPDAPDVELSDAECILFLPLTQQVLHPRNKSWQDESLLQYNPTLSEPEAYDPFVERFETYDKRGFADPPTAPPSLSGLHMVTLQEWPLAVSTWCTQCSHPFRSPPVYLPRALHVPQWVSVYPHWVFCSFACARSYNEEHLGGIRPVTETNMMLTALLAWMTGKPSTVKRAPARHLLAVFGGTLSIEQYRTDEPSLVFFPPLLPLSIITETISNSHVTYPLNQLTVPVRRIKPVFRPFSRIEQCLIPDQ